MAPSLCLCFCKYLHTNPHTRMEDCYVVLLAYCAPSELVSVPYSTCIYAFN